MFRPLHTQGVRALRRFCLACQGGSHQAITVCGDDSCHLYKARNGTLSALEEKERPLRDIRRHCVQCAGSRQEVRACDAKEVCLLWSYRFGVTPAVFKRVAARTRKRLQTLMLPGLQA